MIGGFSPIPNSYKDLFRRETYGEGVSNIIVGFPLALIMMLFWDLVIVPYRKIVNK